MRLGWIGMAAVVVGSMACMPKGVAEDTGVDSNESSSGDSSSTSGASEGTGPVVVTGDPEPTTGGPGECTPGDTKPSEGDCGPDCTCTDAGVWACPKAFMCGEPGTTTTETTTGDTTTGGTTTGDTTSGDTTTGGVKIDLPMCDELAPSDELALEKVAILGDALTFFANFEGGCEKHDLVLCLVGFKDETALLGIDHDAHMDGCGQPISEPRSLDLTPLQALPSPVEISVEGWQYPLEYAY